MPKGPRGRLTAYHKSWADWLTKQTHHARADTLTEDDITEIKRTYYAMISLVDQKAGEIIALLEQEGSLDNTWIIYTSDHGEMLWDHVIMGKFIFQFPSVDVPGIIRPPHGKPTVSVVASPVENFALNPTMLDIAGLAPLDHTPAQSLLPLMNGSTGKGLAFSEVAGDKDNDPYFASVTDGAYRLTIDARANVPVEFCDIKNDPDEGIKPVDGMSERVKSQRMKSDSHSREIFGRALEPHTPPKDYALDDTSKPSSPVRLKGSVDIERMRLLGELRKTLYYRQHVSGEDA